MEIASKVPIEGIKNLAIDTTAYTRGNTLFKTFGDIQCKHYLRNSLEHKLVFLQSIYQTYTITVAIDVSIATNPIFTRCHCSCSPDIKELKGCKHVVAQLLFFIRSPRSFVHTDEAFDIEKEILAKLNPSKDESKGTQPNKPARRVLPSWMSSTSDKGEKGEKAKGKGKTKEKEKESVYMMNEEDLLLAAKEFLRRSGTSSENNKEEQKTSTPLFDAASSAFGKTSKDIIALSKAQKAAEEEEEPSSDEGEKIDSFEEAKESKNESESDLLNQNIAREKNSSFTPEDEDLDFVFRPAKKLKIDNSNVSEKPPLSSTTSSRSGAKTNANLSFINELYSY